MLSIITSHAPLGIEGEIISVEVDLRSGISGIDIVGLPDGAVKEARERVWVAIRNSGFRFPTRRILVNLAPVGLRKEGAAFDLSIAFGILFASEQIPGPGSDNIMVLGELNLAGEVRPVRGVLSAVAAGLKNGKTTFFVPEENRFEAEALDKGLIFGVSSLKQAVGIFTTKEPDQLLQNTSHQPHKKTTSLYDTEHYGDLSDVKGHWVLKRALKVAATGRYNLFLFGPPGSGKTMAAQRLPTILPPLSGQESLEVTQIHSFAGMLDKDSGLITHAPLRIPHHSASTEGVIGGGRIPRPGEVSLAHHGILFLDEASQLRLSSDIRF